MRFVKIKYLYIISHIYIRNNIVISTSFVKEIKDKIQKNIEKSKNFKIYGNLNFGLVYGMRLSRKNPLTRIHYFFRKKNFIKNITQVKYRQLNNIQDFSKYTEYNINEIEANKLWDYFFNTIDGFYYNNNDEYSNILKYIPNETLVKDFQKNNYNRSIIESICNINYVYYIYSFNIIKDNKLDVGEIFYFYNYVNGSNLKNGISKDNNFASSWDQNIIWYSIDKQKLKTGKDFLLLKDIEKKHIEKMVSCINNNNIYLYKNLVAIMDADKTHYFLIDENKKIWHWKDHEASFNIEKGKFNQVESFSLKNDEEKKSTTISSSATQEKEIQNLEFSKIKLINQLFQDDIRNSSYLSFLYLLSENIPNDFPKKILEISRLESFVEVLTKNGKIFEFNTNNRDVLNKVFYFVLGYNGQENLAGKGVLPLSFLKVTNVTKESIQAYIKEDGANLENNIYDLSDYNDIKNDEFINNSLMSLPKFNEYTISSIYASCGIYGLYDLYIISICFNYTLSNNIQSHVKDLDSKYSPYILEMAFGIQIINNLYLCIVNELLLPSVYKFNTFCDYSVGFGIIISSLPFMIKIFIVYDIYNNILNIKSSIGAITILYGNDNYNESDDFYVEYENIYYSNENTYNNNKTLNY